MEYLFTVFSVLIIMLSSIIIAKIKIKASQFVLTLIITSTMAVLIVPISEPLAGITVVIMTVIFLYKLGTQIIAAIAIGIFSLIISVISDNCVNFIFSEIVKINIFDAQRFRENITLYTYYYLGVFIIAFVMSKGVGMIFEKYKNTVIGNRYGKIIISSIIMTLIVIYTGTFIGNEQGIVMYAVIHIFYFILLIIMVYGLLITSIKEEMVKSREKQWNQLNEYTKNLETLYENTRKNQHDYMNILVSIKGYMDGNDMTGLKRYFDDKIIPYHRQIEDNISTLGLLSHIVQPEIKGILSAKIIQAYQLQIQVSVEIQEEFSITEMDIIDISRILGILLDNAIEAAEKCNHAVLKLAFINKNNTQIILVMNTCSEYISHINQVYQKGYSTKGEGRGQGLYSLRSIIDTYSYVFNNTEIKNGEFIQEIKIESTPK